MKIETLTNLIGGELINRPYISEVVNFTDNVDEVKRGSCFFARDLTDIPRAIKNGAYAIITDRYVEVLDKEIAWIKVDNFENAAFNIFKYENLKHQIYIVDKISLMIIDAISLDKRVIVLRGVKDFFKVINLKEKFIFTDDKKFVRIFANVKSLKEKDVDLKPLGLFKSVYEGSEINLPFVYKNQFGKVISFFNENSLKYTLDFKLSRFRPVFVDALLREVEFGQSERVVITGIENDEFFFDELNFFIENTKHAKAVVIDEKRVNLLKKPFNFAMAVGFEFVANKIEEKGLFND